MSRIKMSKDVVPFAGAEVLDTEPVEVTNPFSGQSIMLNPVEVTVYDITMGASRLGAYSTVQVGLEWFRRFNPKAYMVLLD
jgi:uncharacterized protein YegJ (DUF2314 family)